MYKCQVDWANLALEYWNRDLFVKAAVEHGKSEVFGYILPLRDICADRNMQQLFATASPILKKSTTIRLRDTLKDNDKLIKDFGEFYSPRNLWESSKFTVIRPSANLRDPTFTATTTGQAIEGIKADKGILDDPTDINAATSEARRKSDSRWFRMTFMNRLKAGAPVHAIMTRWHPEDIAKDFEMGEMFAPNNWMEAIDTEWNPSSILCPERWSLKLLRDRHKKIGELAFEQKFRNNPRSVIGAKLNPEWMLPYYTERPELVSIGQTIDTSGGKAKGDYYCRLTCGLGNDNKIYDLDMVYKHLLFPEQEEDVYRGFYTWKPDFIVIETNADDSALYNQCLKKGILPLYPHHESRNKLAKIQAHSVYFKNGQYRVRENNYDFIREFVNFPGAHDDALDCSCMMIDFWRGDIAGADEDTGLPTLR